MKFGKQVISFAGLDDTIGQMLKCTTIGWIGKVAPRVHIHIAQRAKEHRAEQIILFCGSQLKRIYDENKLVS